MQSESATEQPRGPTVAVLRARRRNLRRGRCMDHPARVLMRHAWRTFDSGGPVPGDSMIDHLDRLHSIEDYAFPEMELPAVEVDEAEHVQLVAADLQREHDPPPEGVRLAITLTSAPTAPPAPVGVAA
ncbi:MAG: hypothetical protein WCA29_09485 [Jiangellales bacterium]